MESPTGPMIALGIFLVGQLIAAVSWASAINTKMNFMLDIGKDMKALEKSFTEAQVKYSTQEDVLALVHNSKRDFTVVIAGLEKEIQAIWKRVDELKTLMINNK